MYLEVLSEPSDDDRLCAPPSWQQGRWACLPRHMTHWYGRKLSSVQLLSHVWLFATPWTAARQAYLSITNSWSSLKLMSIDSCPCQWCHPAISSSVVPVSSCLQSFPASGSFQMRQFFITGGQKIGASASASVLPMNIQDWFAIGLNGLFWRRSALGFLWKEWC